MSKHLSKLRALEGAAVGEYVTQYLQSPSPGINWTFANAGHGLQFGLHSIFWGPPKCGKSYVAKMFASQLHKDDPTAIVLEFNTELRGRYQSSPAVLSKLGIDPERYVPYDVNTPEMIFDRIEKDVPAAIQDGDNVRLIIIDSMTNIQGRRTLNSSTVSDQQIGDKALTLQTGLERILPIIRKYNIALITTAHARAEMDRLQQMRGRTIKMANAWAVKHLAEYFCYIEKNETKEGRTNLAGEKFEDEGTKDFMDRAERSGHKIRFQVTESSFGVSNRAAEFTLSYDKGIVNVHEEIFLMARNTGVIEKPSNAVYKFKDQTWKGLVACLTAIQDNEGLSRELLTEVYKRDTECR